MAGSSLDDDDGINGINVTPLVDVVLVLLIIFMVTANFIVHDSVEVDLPRAANAKDRTVQGPVMVTMDREANTYFDGQAVSQEQLMERLRSAVGRDASVRAIISADQSLNYGKVVFLIDLVKEAGIGKFALNIQRGRATDTPAVGR